ncbi:MAG TPA: hypothetical protein VH561_15795 [Micromonosporaceae bacterium]|jgi:hypothetical protein
MARAALIDVHLAAGLLGLVLGLPAMRRPMRSDRWLWIRRAYFGTLVVLTITVIIALVLDWPTLDAATRATFSALCALAAFVCVRAVLALRIAELGLVDRARSLVNHQYFTYVALWEGALIVTMITSGLPTWAVVMVAVALPFAGAPLIAAYQRRLSATAPR